MLRGQETFKRKWRLRSFVEAYIGSGANATKAAAAVGCKGKPASLRVSGHRLKTIARNQGLFTRFLSGEDIWADLWPAKQKA